MPEQQVEPQKLSAFFDMLAKAGINVTNKEGMAAWLNDKIRKGSTIEDITARLQSSRYDFKRVDKELEESFASKKADSSDVVKRVEELETKIGDEERKKKEQSFLNWIVSAFVIAFISAGLSYFLNKQIVDIDTSVMGEAGGFLNTFIKAGWVIGIAAGFVGLMLLAMFISERYKNKKLLPRGEQKPI